MHIEKCGGTTLISLLQRNYFHFLYLHSPVLPNEDAIFTNGHLKRLVNNYPKLRGIGGHAVTPSTNYGAVVDNPFFITMLRNPIDRYVSHLNFQNHNMGKNWTIDSFLNETRFNNYQVRKIAGSEDLASAKKILKEQFTFVGLLEFYEESMLLLKHRLGDSHLDIRYQQLNKITPKQMTTRFEEQDASIKEKIKAANLLDLALYQYCKEELFASYHKDYGSTFSKDVQKFKNQNAEYTNSGWKRLQQILRNRYTLHILRPFHTSISE